MVFVDLGKGGLNSSQISNFIIFFPAVCVKRSNRCLSRQQKNEVRMSMYFFFYYLVSGIFHCQNKCFAQQFSRC